MGYDLDAAYEDFTEWLHDEFSAPGTLHCDNCGEYFSEEDEDWIEFHGFTFCCEGCFNEGLITMPTLRQVLDEYPECGDDFLPS